MYFLKPSVWIAGVVLAFSPLIVRASDSDLKPEPKFDDSRVQKYDAEVDDASFGNEVEAIDNDSYHAAARQAQEDEKRLKAEMVNLEKQKRIISAEKNSLKESSARAAHDLELQTKRNDNATKQLNAAKQERVLEEQKNQQIRASLKQLEAQEKVIQEGNRKVEVYIRFAREERAEMIKRVNLMRASQPNEKRKQQEQFTKISQYRKQTKDREAQATAHTQVQMAQIGN